MSSFKFDWKTNRNFCLTAKHMFDFDTEEGDTARENDKYFEYALKLEHRDIPYCTFRLVGYYKTEDAAEKAMVQKVKFFEYGFIWNRKGECVNGAY